MRLRLPHTCVYWEPGPADKFGNPTVKAPQQLPCRWDDSAEEIIGKDSTVVYASSTVILACDVKVGGVLMLGRIADLGDTSFIKSIRDIKNAREILSRDRTPALRGNALVVKAYLK